MKLMSPSVEIMSPIGDNVLQFIERCGRVCYKSEDKITDTSAQEFVKNLIKRGHESVLEHYHITVRFITDRGVSHEIVRHRLASYSQESTRYCNYGDSDIAFMDPGGDACLSNLAVLTHLSLHESATRYKQLIKLGAQPQYARAVLPNALKTEIIMSANLREYRHFLKLRCAGSAHPQMRQVAVALCQYLQKKIPVIFDDIGIAPVARPTAAVTESWNML